MMMGKAILLVAILCGAVAQGAAETGKYGEPPRGWEGLNVAFIGDSITTKHQHHAIYWQYLAAWLKWETVHSYGISGHAWNHAIQQIDWLTTSMSNDVDAVFVMLGTNDYAGGTDLGEWYEIKEAPVNWWGKERTLPHRTFAYTMGTFKGRINCALAKLKRRYPDTQIVLLTPPQRAFFSCSGSNVQPAQDWPNEKGRYIEEYVAAIKEAGTIWSCPVIDLYGESGLTPLLKDEYAPFYRDKEKDLLHPNAEGHRRMAELIYCRLKALPATFRRKGPSSSERACGYDVNAADFARKNGETDDSGRLQRAIEAASPYGVLYIPKGVYEIGSTLWVTNRASVLMHKSAILRATREIDYVLAVDLKAQWELLGKKGTDAVEDYNFFVKGGQIDGNGLASCMVLDRYRHFSLSQVTFLNGKKYGLRVDGLGGGGYELVATDCYFKTVIHGCKGNEAICSTGGDSHYIDCIVVDYTIGFHFAKEGFTNHLTRCHVWGGGIREMLDDSVNFLIEEDGTILTDCYADTGKVGFWVKANNTRLIGCFYYSNPCFKLDDISMVRQDSGSLLVSGCSFTKTAKNVRAFDHRGGKAEWRDCIYNEFDKDDEKPGELFGEAR